MSFAVFIKDVLQSGMSQEEQFCYRSIGRRAIRPATIALCLPTYDVEAFDRNHERDVITTSGEELSAERRAEGL